MHSISPSLIRAYRESKFIIEVANPITLLIGQSNVRLRALLKEQQSTTAAFLTAYNPHSKVRNEQENINAQNALLQDIKNLGLMSFNGFGQDIAEQWPKEISVLILNINESQAEELADKYSQNAFVWIGSEDAFPTLRLRYPIAVPTREEISHWLNNLPINLSSKAKTLNPIEQAWMMTVSELDQKHWLDTDSWDLNQVWPLAKPDGSAMGIGTELDRVFKLIAAGQSKIVRN
jgi:hypothetical protein